MTAPAPDSAILSIDFAADTTRRCGACQLCCKLLPAKELDKPDNTRCQHQKVGVGCRIYASRPASCRFWSCRWLTMADTAELKRPDRSHYVLDPVPDYVTAVDNTTGAERVVPCIQIWCDPDYREAHRDPALRRFLERRAAEGGWCGLVRYGTGDAVLLVPPSMSENRRWNETGSMLTRREHSLFDTINAISTGVDHARRVD